MINLGWIISTSAPLESRYSSNHKVLTTEDDDLIEIKFLFTGTKSTGTPLLHADSIQNDKMCITIENFLVSLARENFFLE